MEYVNFIPHDDKIIVIQKQNVRKYTVTVSG